MYGVSTTYHDELYTTKLDPAKLPKEVRDKADRIARELEGGQMASEKEGILQGEEDDEEARFSAVQGGSGAVAHGRKEVTSSKSSNQAPLPQLPPARDLGGQHDML